MNINPIKKQPVSDDPDLVKALSGIDGIQEEALQYEGLEEPSVEAGEIMSPMANYQDQPQIEQEVIAEAPQVTQDFAQNEVVTPVQNVETPSLSLNLEDIKNHALNDLRPLVDKLNVSNEEKFDIYLLLLRSSDDNSLIQPAYNAAKLIEDESRRANALLDVIKEADYFINKK